MSAFNYKKMTSEELMLSLSAIIEQVNVLRRGLKEHPEDQVFSAALPFMINEGKEIMKEFTFRGNTKSFINQEYDKIIVDKNDGYKWIFIQTESNIDDQQMIAMDRNKIPELIKLLEDCI